MKDVPYFVFMDKLWIIYRYYVVKTWYVIMDFSVFRNKKIFTDNYYSFHVVTIDSVQTTAGIPDDGQPNILS